MRGGMMRGRGDPRGMGRGRGRGGYPRGAGAPMIPERVQHGKSPTVATPDNHCTVLLSKNVIQEISSGFPSLSN